MENMVSIWLGNFETEKALLEYTQESYTEDGEYVPSTFCEEFFGGEEPFEIDSFERYSVSEASMDIRALLEGCSYDESVISSLMSIIGDRFNKEYNSVILIYDFAASDELKQIKGKADYIASVTYQKI